MASATNPFAQKLGADERYYSAKEEEELIFDLTNPVGTQDRDRPFDSKYGQYHRQALKRDPQAESIGARIKQSAALSAEHMGHLSDLDLIASSILALVYSSTSIENIGTQLGSNLKTVAVALHLKTLYVAHNGLDLGKFIAATKKKPEKHERVLTDKGDKQFVKQLKINVGPVTWDHFTATDKVTTFCPETAIENFFKGDAIFESMVSTVRLLNLGLKAYKHAEAGLLEYFMNELNCTPDAIGVSKPCCQACGRILMAFGVSFTCVHNIDATLLTHYELPKIPADKEKSEEWNKALAGLRTK